MADRNQIADQLATHPLRGSIFETFIIGELVKSRFNQGEKAGKTLSTESTRGLSKYMSLAGQDATSPTLIYGGSDSYKKQDIRITSWRENGSILLQHSI